MKSRPTRSLLLSVAMHVVLGWAAWYGARRFADGASTSHEPASVEVEFLRSRPVVAAAPAPAPAAAATPAPTEPARAHVQPPATIRARTVTRVEPTSPTPTETSAPVETQPQPTVQPTPPTNATPPGRILTAADLYANADQMANAVAQQGLIDLGPPGTPRRSRDLFGTRHPTGSPADQIRQVALGPALAALADSNHMQPAGAGRHDSQVAARAAESFSPVRSIANLGVAVSRAPRVGLAAQAHQASAAEVAATDGLDGAHPNSFAMATMLATPPPPVHMLRAEVEVDQDASGNIRATRVVTASGVRSFDEAALRAIREAIPEVTNVQSREGRRSRWAFEVSEAQGVLAGIAGGGNDGWLVSAETSNGVRIRYRVRMVGAHPWQGS